MRAAVVLACARLRRVIAANAHREEITDSDFELLVLALLVEHGLPEPVLHHRIFDGSRFVAEVDLAYPELRIAIELDGKVHLEPEVRERDLPRQNDLGPPRLDRAAVHLASATATTRPPSSPRSARPGEAAPALARPLR